MRLQTFLWLAAILGAIDTAPGVVAPADASPMTAPMTRTWGKKKKKHKQSRPSAPSARQVAPAPPPVPPPTPPPAKLEPEPVGARPSDDLAPLGSLLVQPSIRSRQRPQPPPEGFAPDAWRAAPLHPMLEGIGSPEELITRARLDPSIGRYVSDLGDGREVILTLDPRLQQRLEAMIQRDKPQGAGVVAMDPRDGRILALVQFDAAGDARGRALEPRYPAASIFKIVTGAALLEAGIPPDEQVCFHGGLQRIDARLLTDDPRRDSRCDSFAGAMGRSLNVIFGKLANRALEPDALRSMATRFLFNQPVPVFPHPTGEAGLPQSAANIPDDTLEFGRAAAGFGRVYMSPLHGALLASVVGSKGLARHPRLVEAVRRGGEHVPAPHLPARRIVTESVAAELGYMMHLTITQGTATKYFHTYRGSMLPGIAAAGKTGSLSDKSPFRDYSWFVGFAPLDQPSISVSVVIENGAYWRTKGSLVAREAFRAHFGLDPVAGGVPVTKTRRTKHVRRRRG